MPNTPRWGDPDDTIVDHERKFRVLIIGALVFFGGLAVVYFSS